jgi:Abortive infection alpha
MFSLTRVVRDLVVSPTRPPGRSDLGSGLRALARVALAPMSSLPRAATELPELLRTLGERSLSIPANRRRTPNPGMALRALAGFVRGDGAVRAGYLSLLTATMDRAVAHDVHPAFIDLLGQLGSDELSLLASLGTGGPFPLLSLSSRLRHGGASRIELRAFSLLGERAGCENPARTPAYLDNLARLGLVEIRPTRITDDVRMFQELEEHPTVVAARARIEGQPPVRIGPISEPIVADVQYKSLFVTAFGQQFRGACFFRPDAVERDAHGSDLVTAPS